MRHGRYAAVALALAIGSTATACSHSDSASTATSTAAAATSSAVESSQLPSLVPTPANSQPTRGPDAIADNGIHLHFQVNGAPGDVMAAYNTALVDKGWAVTTVVTSSGGGGGGSTYTGTHGDAYGVFDGGGYNTTTYMDVCVWPSKPANPNCTRGDR